MPNINFNLLVGRVSGADGETEDTTHGPHYHFKVTPVTGKDCVEVVINEQSRDGSNVLVYFDLEVQDREVVKMLDDISQIRPPSEDTWFDRETLRVTLEQIGAGSFTDYRDGPLNKYLSKMRATDVATIDGFLNRLINKEAAHENHMIFVFGSIYRNDNTSDWGIHDVHMNQLDGRNKGDDGMMFVKYWPETGNEANAKWALYIAAFETQLDRVDNRGNAKMTLDTRERLNGNVDTPSTKQTLLPAVTAAAIPQPTREQLSERRTPWADPGDREYCDRPENRQKKTGEKLASSDDRYDDKDYLLAMLLYQKLKEIPEGDEKEELHIELQKIVIKARRALSA